MSWTTDLLAGIAQRLENEAGATWKASGDYAPGDPWPVVIMSVPASPDRVIVLTPYPVDEPPMGTDVLQGVQIRTRSGRGDPTPLDDANDAIFDALHGLAGVTLAGVPVVQMYRTSGSYLGTDSNGRHEWTSNFYVQAIRPGGNRTD